MHNLFTISILILIAGFLFIGAGGFSFKFRALMNKKAWGGKTVMFFKIGIVLSIIGGIMVYSYYPYG